MSDETLRKCPFCGSGAVHWELVDGWWNACCHACDTRTGRYDTQEAATAAWNRRVPGASAVPVEVREAIDWLLTNTVPQNINLVATWFGMTQVVRTFLHPIPVNPDQAQEDSHE